MIKVREYHCNECAFQFEKFVTHDAQLVECPKCGSGDTNSVLAPSSFKVNGVGAYNTKMKV